MNYRKFFQNAVILTGTGFLLRGAGLLLRVLLANVLGEGGMGLYSLTFTVYNLFITLAQSGIGVAVTRLTAEYLALQEEGRLRGALKGCLRWAAILGCASGAMLFLGAPLLAGRWIGDPACGPALKILACSLPFLAISGCFGGYFLGCRKVQPGCIAQTMEQAVRLGLVAGAVLLFRGASMARLLAAVVFANTISEGVSCLFLACLAAKGRGRAEPILPSKGRIRRIALPVAASRYLSTALHTTENMLIPLAIARYTGDYGVGLAEFGALKGMAIPLLFFPASFLTALSSLLVPEVTETSARAEWRATGRIVSNALSVTASLSIMIGGVFWVYGEALGQVLYQSESVSMMLKVLAPITPFMYMDTIADGLLKGLDQQGKAFRNNMIDSTLRILLTVFAVPAFGIKGFLGVMVFSNILVCTLNMATLLKCCGLQVRWREWLFKPLAALGLATAIHSFLPFGAGLPQYFLGALAWCGIYLLFSWLTLPEKNSIIKIKKG